MQQLNLEILHISNSKEKIKNITDKQAFEAYNGIYKSYQLFKEDSYEFFFKKFSLYYSGMFFMPINSSSFLDYYQINNYQQLLNPEFCLDKSKQLYYLDQTIKNKIIQYFYFLISEYKEQKNKFNEPFNLLSKKDKEDYLTINSYITDYLSTIDNIQAFYDRKMLLFCIS